MSALDDERQWAHRVVDEGNRVSRFGIAVLRDGNLTRAETQARHQAWVEWLEETDG